MKRVLCCSKCSSRFSHKYNTIKYIEIKASLLENYNEHRARSKENTLSTHLANTRVAKVEVAMTKA